MKPTRRQRPNIKYKCRFYKYGVPLKDDTPVPNEFGELVSEFSLFAVGLFAKELPLKPTEAEEGNRTIAEQKFMLVSKWTTSLSKVTHGMYCYILRQQKLFVVDGNATDQWGDRQNIYINIVDNVTQDIATKFPGAPL